MASLFEFGTDSVSKSLLKLYEYKRCIKCLTNMQVTAVLSTPPLKHIIFRADQIVCETTKERDLGLIHILHLCIDKTVFDQWPSYRVKAYTVLVY